MGCFADDPELPPPTSHNSLQIYVLDPGLLNPDLDVDQKTDHIRQIMRRLDPEGLYVQVGIALPYRPTGIEPFEAALRARTPLALLGGPTTHHTGDWLQAEVLEQNPECAQWLEDGSFGPGAEDGRLWASPSIYADDVVSARKRAAAAMADRLLSIQTDYPDAVRLIVGPMEVSLCTGGYPDMGADYSPLVIRQFRDWLTHRSVYSSYGPLAGQGFAGGEAYADDPGPDEAEGGNDSLNDHFGTDFNSWTILPPKGDAATERPGPWFATGQRASDWAATWQAFRRHLVSAWSDQHIRWLEEFGDLLPSICPTVFLPGDETWQSLAATGGIPTAGDMIFLDGSVDDILAASAELEPGRTWGAIVDVPRRVPPGADASDWLGGLLRAGPSVIIVRSWDDSTGGYASLAQSGMEASFAAALERLDDKPWGTPDFEYSPPPVRQVAAEATRDGNRITWSSRIFDDSPVRWDEWQPFREFAVSRTHPNPLLLGTTAGTSFIDPDAAPGATYQVRALVD